LQLTRVLLTVTCALGLASPTLLAQSEDWRFAHPQATLVGGVRVAALLQSPLLKTALDQASAQNPQVGMGLALAQTLFKGINDVRFSIVDNGTPSPDTLVLVMGTLDPTTLAMLQGTGQAQGQTPGPAKTETYTVNPTTLLIGSGASLKAAIARLSQDPADLVSAAFLHAGKITPGYDLWIAGQIPKIPSLPLPPDLNLQGFAFGMSLSDKISLEVAAETTTADQAEALVKVLRNAESAQPAGPGAVRPEISAQGTTARLRVSVPMEQVMEAMKNPALAGLIGAAPNTLQPLPQPPKPAKPSRGTVIIEGLEGGPLEFPIDPPQARPGTVR